MNEISLVELLWNINRRIGRRLAPLAQKEGLSLGEMVVLWKTHHAGERRVTALADELGVPPSTLTGMLDRLVESGWLERDRDPDDRRAVVMKGTEKLGELIRNLKHASSRSIGKSVPQPAAGHTGAPGLRPGDRPGVPGAGRERE